jgi:hypothetical protein
MSINSIRRLTTLTSHLRPITQQASATQRTFKLGSSLSTQTTAAMASDAKTLVDQAIKENKVLMFGKTYCPVSPILSCCKHAYDSTARGLRLSWRRREI